MQRLLPATLALPTTLVLSITLALSATFTALSAGPAAAAAGPPRQVLIVMDEREQMEALAKRMKENAGIESVIVDQKSLPADWSRFDAVLAYVHGPLREPTELKIIDYTNKGGRYVCLHHSISSGKATNKHYFEFLGVHLEEPAQAREPAPQGGHYAWREGVDFTIVNLNPAHYITSHDVAWPEMVAYRSSDFPSVEREYPGLTLKHAEVYMNHHFSDGREKTVLLGFKYLDDRNGVLYMQDREGWLKPAGDGHIVYLQMGHTTQEFENPIVARVITNAVTWSPGRSSAPVLATEAAAPRDVDVNAPDGTKLKATYYAASRPGPGVLLLHMCNSNRKAWEPVGQKLSAAGIHALALDYRGYGESGGQRFEDDPQKQQQVITEKWPGDVDAALAALLAQPGVDPKRVGVGGGSCGVNQAVHVAIRHPEVASLVLLAGETDREGRAFLMRTPGLPIFAGAAADDQFDADAPRSMQWLLDLSGNPRNRFAGFADGRHGTEIFGPHPELPVQIVEWYVDTLARAPADPRAAVATKKTPALEFWSMLDEPGGPARAARVFRDARRRDPKAFLFPEGAMNLAAYERLQAGHVPDATLLFKLNVEAYPSSANTYDSLGDAYVAAGKTDLAVQATNKCLELLPADKTNDARKKLIEQSARQKLEKLKAAAVK